MTDYNTLQEAEEAFYKWLEELEYVYCEVCGYNWTREDPCPYH